MPSDYFIAHFRDQGDGFLGGCKDNSTWMDVLIPLYPNVNKPSCCVSEPALLSHGGRDTPVLRREPHIAGGWPACFLARACLASSARGQQPQKQSVEGTPKRFSDFTWAFVPTGGQLSLLATKALWQWSWSSESPAGKTRP